MRVSQHTTHTQHFIRLYKLMKRTSNRHDKYICITDVVQTLYQPHKAPIVTMRFNHLSKSIGAFSITYNHIIRQFKNMFHAHICLANTPALPLNTFPYNSYRISKSVFEQLIYTEPSNIEYKYTTKKNVKQKCNSAVLWRVKMNATPKFHKL